MICGVEGLCNVAGVGGQRALARLREWGFNVLGAGTAPEFQGHGWPHLEMLDLRRAGVPLLRRSGVNLPDVFDPGWQEASLALAVAAHAGPGIAGYVSDMDLEWGQPPSDGAAPVRPTQLQVCLSLDPQFAAYHAAWEFVLAPRGGELGALNRAWALGLPNRETLRQMTLEEQALATPGYLLDHARFTREFAQRYFRVVAAAVRRADPGRLYFGVPLTASSPAELRETALAHVDVLLSDHVPAGASTCPVLLRLPSWLPFADAKPQGEMAPLSRLERMLRGGREHLVAALSHPAVVGYTWTTYVGGDREQAPFGGGLMYSDGSAASENVEPLRAINAAAATVHRRAIR